MMLTEAKIKELFLSINKKLEKRGDIAEIGIIGGAVMCWVFRARAATRDVDAIFQPASVVREIVAEIAAEENLSSDWLNDAAKTYIQGNFIRQDILSLSNLRVWHPEAKYMLAMKCISARWDSSDRDDVLFLIDHLKIKSAREVFTIIEAYYPKRQIPPKTQFLIEEVFETK